MTYEEISKDGDYHEWFKYEPHDSQYVRFCESNPSAIAAGYKIADVYHSFCMAKASLLYTLESNYGDLARKEDSFSNLFVKAMFIQNAIFQYAICEDLSWQVVWAYILPSDIEYLMKNEYEKMTKECNRDNLLEQLNCAISQKVLKAERIKDIVSNFDNDEDVMKFRTLYNYLKHRGNIHIEGLGNQDEYLMTMVNGKMIKIPSRETYSLEELQEMAWKYHQKFKNYFSNLIAEIMPANFTNTTVSYKEWIMGNLKMAGIDE